MKSLYRYVVRRIILLFFLVFMLQTCNIRAQHLDLAAKASDNSYATPYLNVLYEPRFSVGIRGGLGISGLRFTDQSLSFYDHIHRRSGLLGLCVQMPLGTPMVAIRPELLFSHGGDSLQYEDIHYGVRFGYFDARLPLLLRIPVSEHFVPYALMAPHVQMVTSGSLYYVDRERSGGVTLDMTTANMRKHSLGLLFGVGVEWRIDFVSRPLFVSMEAAYNLGLANTFSEREIAGNTGGASIGNSFLGARLWNGSRYNRGFEISVGVRIPLDGKYMLGYYRQKASAYGNTDLQGHLAVESRSDSGRDTIYIFQKDTVVVDRARNEYADYQTKDCKTIKEIFDMVYRGEPIDDKRICMFNINFGFDSYDISMSAEELLFDLLRLMREFPEMTIGIYGHTDGNGTADYNQHLSENRADAVANWLIDHGVHRGRIRSYGMGMFYPIASEESEEGQSKNRRVEIEIFHTGRRYMRNVDNY